MKTFFTGKIAVAMIAVAASFSLMSFSEETYVPAGLGYSQQVATLSLEQGNASEQVIVAAVARVATRATARATRAAVNYARITANAARAVCPEVARQAGEVIRTAGGITTVFAELSEYDKSVDVAYAKVVKTKMKALG